MRWSYLNRALNVLHMGVKSDLYDSGMSPLEKYQQTIRYAPITQRSQVKSYDMTHSANDNNFMDLVRVGPRIHGIQ